MKTLSSIKRLHKLVVKELFFINGTLDYDRVTDALITLANAVHNYSDETEELWYIGEDDHISMDDLIVGAYWHFTEWHGGQWSKGYAALCALGTVFSPNMSSVEPDNDAYIALFQALAKA